MKKILVTSALLLFTHSALAEQQYTMIIDAGSTGSRLHLFQYEVPSPLPEIQDIFVAKDKTQPGLSSFANNPEAAGASLKKVLDDALTQMKNRNIDPRSVEINVLATAGMRLLDPAIQNMIYASVTNYIKNNYPYPIGAIETIPGKMEGVYDWLDVNYLQKNFQNNTPTVGTIDLGGASVQIAFATQNSTKPEDEVKLLIGNYTYTVFSKSFLGLGQDEARKIIDNSADAASCYPINYPVHPSTPGLFNFTSCAEDYLKVLRDNKVSEQIASTQNQNFVAFSGIFYAYNFLGVEKTPEKTIVDQRIQTVCNTTWEQLQKNYPNVLPVYLSAYCANSIYTSDLLYNAFNLVGAQLTVTDKIDNQEPAWPLGAMLYKLINH